MKLKVDIKAISFEEGIKYIVPILAELNKRAIAYDINKKTHTVVFVIPTYIPKKEK